jgi:general secretion pathway protein G
MSMTPSAQTNFSGRGFTLVELLVVLLIVGILSGLLFSLSSGIFGKGARSQAVSDLQAITVALEAYRNRFGDYPDMVGSRQFFDAFDGKRGPKGDTLSPAFPPFLESGQFLPGNEDHPELLDPWGQPYLYRYLPGTDTSRLNSYALFSSGPDTKSSPDGEGPASENDDNLWPDD